MKKSHNLTDSKGWSFRKNEYEWIICDSDNHISLVVLDDSGKIRGSITRESDVFRIWAEGIVNVRVPVDDLHARVIGFDNALALVETHMIKVDDILDSIE